MSYKIDDKNKQVIFQHTIPFDEILRNYDTHADGTEHPTSDRLTPEKQLEIIDRIAGDVNSCFDYQLDQSAESVCGDEDVEWDEEEDV